MKKKKKKIIKTPRKNIYILKQVHTCYFFKVISFGSVSTIWKTSMIKIFHSVLSQLFGKHP